MELSGTLGLGNNQLPSQASLRKVLIVSPFFPPSTLAGVHRARHLAKHLPAAGWTPIVLCVDEAYQEERLDLGLARLVSSSTEVIKVAALSAKLTRPFGVGEVSLRAWGPIRREVKRLLGSRKIDAVLITGSPYYPMLLAEPIKRRFAVPVVLDFQDPWVSDAGAKQPKFSKAGLSHHLATVLEPLALRGADYITSVSDRQNADMAARYPWLDRAQMASLPIGGDSDDFAALREQPLNAAHGRSFAGRRQSQLRGHVHAALGPTRSGSVSRFSTIPYEQPYRCDPYSIEFLRHKQSTQRTCN